MNYRSLGYLRLLYEMIAMLYCPENSHSRPLSIGHDKLVSRLCGPGSNLKSSAEGDGKKVVYPQQGRATWIGDSYAGLSSSKCIVLRQPESILDTNTISSISLFDLWHS